MKTEKDIRERIRIFEKDKADLGRERRYTRAIDRLDTMIGILGWVLEK